MTSRCGSSWPERGRKPADDPAEALREADRLAGPDHLEFPDTFDVPRELSRLRAPVERLNSEFSCRCQVSEGIQDASFLATVGIPAAATQASEGIAIRLSNFGGLAVVAAEGFGIYDDLDEAQAHGALTEADRRKAECAVTELRYVPIPEPLLHRPYDGVTGLPSFYPHETVTWWTRFFDYL
ncbi:hypothetical protein T261_04733 [Streptomyces lydicus]|nr:hypothetical protein T261_04733 [Streptomyces lydicus]